MTLRVQVRKRPSVPAVETLEKFGRALDIPLYQLSYDGDESPKVSSAKKPGQAENGWGENGKDSRTLDRFRRLVSRIDEEDRELSLSDGGRW